MGIDICNWDEVHIIFRRTMVLMVHEAVRDLPRAEMCCGIIKKLIHNTPMHGYIYADTNNVDQFKTDLLIYLQTNWDQGHYNRDTYSRNRVAVDLVRRELRKSLFCTVTLEHDGVTNGVTEDSDNRLYLNDEEKANFNTCSSMDYHCFDNLLDDKVVGDADANEALCRYFNSSHLRFMDTDGTLPNQPSWSEYIVMRPTIFGMGVDLNKLMKTWMRNRNSNREAR